MKKLKIEIWPNRLGVNLTIDKKEFMWWWHEGKVCRIKDGRGIKYGTFLIKNDIPLHEPSIRGAAGTIEMYWNDCQWAWKDCE